ncbi:MFS transporter [Silvibacterium sp.]|uniref:MFS transporter n=1 Tax=Silvibacterium sp. TaxID=1964179 RepID=UPI0039E6BA20
MPVAVLVLALSAFAIGTTEFVIMGLLPQLAANLHVSLPTTGWLVSGYALSVAVGAPIMAMLTTNLNRRHALMLLMGFFIAGNAMCALSPNFAVLMAARVVTALCHGAFFGIGSVVASSLVAPNRKASAIALMFSGLTIANVLGVPLGTALGQAEGWRSTFWVIAVIGVVAFLGLMRVLPANLSREGSSLLAELKALRNLGVWIAFTMAILFAAAMFALFTYIAPLLEQITGLTPHGVTLTLFLIGTGLTVGNILGGRFADFRLRLALVTIFAATVAASAALFWTAHSLIPAEITLFLWAVFSFAGIPALQVYIMQFAERAPNLAATLNISAFNIGNALGAYAGGLVLLRGLGMRFVPISAAALALAALVATAVSIAEGIRRRHRVLAGV